MKFIFYKDKRKEWRWQLRASNGNIMADSGEGYRRKDRARAAVQTLISRVKSAKLVWDED